MLLRPRLILTVAWTAAIHFGRPEALIPGEQAASKRGSISVFGKHEICSEDAALSRVKSQKGLFAISHFLRACKAA